MCSEAPLSSMYIRSFDCLIIFALARGPLVGSEWDLVSRFGPPFLGVKKQRIWKIQKSFETPSGSGMRFVECASRSRKRAHYKNENWFFNVVLLIFLDCFLSHFAGRQKQKMGPASFDFWGAKMGSGARLTFREGWSNLYLWRVPWSVK